MSIIDRRIGMLFIAFIGLLSVALVRATYLGAIKAGSLQRAAATQQVVQETLPAPRGTITDRHGLEFAISEAADDVIADPYLIAHQDPQTVAQMIAPLLGQPMSTVLTKLTKPRTGFVYLAHLLPGDQAQAIARLRINGKLIDGLSLIPETRRVYPRAWEASQLLGSLYQSGHGYSGLEYRYDNVLTGSNGLRRIVNDAIGQPISIDDLRPTKPGSTLRLTIDSPLQSEVEQVLGAVGAQYSPKGATAIAMDPNTGEILALANWPRVDANDVAGAPAVARQDRAVSFNYEPGSTFKAITVAAALQDGLVTPDTQFNVPSVLQVYDRTIHDAESHGDETLTVSKILKFSSNIGADLIGMKLGAARFSRWVRSFGFGAPTGVDLPGEGRGIILPLARYSGTTMANLPFGQGESVTPIQMAAAYAAIANGGVLRAPHIVQAIDGKPVPTPSGRRILSPTAASQLRDMLRGVFADGGTASGAAIPGYDLAGKTGTASIVVNGQYSSTEYVASFMGFVPASHPRLEVLVVVDQPQGSIFGGQVAAPAFQKIVGWAVPYYGINPCPVPCPATPTSITHGG